MKPDAIRHRRMAARRKAEREAAKLSGIEPVKPEKPVVEKPEASGSPIPLHATKPQTLGGSGENRFTAVPAAPSSSDGSAVPLVPPSVPDADPSDPSSQSDDVAPAASSATPPGPPPGVITPEEAKLFGKALRSYFEFGTGMLLAKHPEFAGGLVQISGTVDEFRKNFAIAAVLVEGCGERVATKYNLRIPYLDEAVVVGAIGIATFGLAGKPSKAGEAAIKQAQEAQRAQQARDANPSAQPPSREPEHVNGKSTQPPPESAEPMYESTPINPNAAAGIALD